MNVYWESIIWVVHFSWEIQIELEWPLLPIESIFGFLGFYGVEVLGFK
jgi:hypothetical protein